MSRLQTTLRLPDELADKLKDVAARESLSVNQYITRLIRESVNNRVRYDLQEELEETANKLGISVDALELSLMRDAVTRFKRTGKLTIVKPQD